MPTTRNASKKKTINKPAQPVLKIKLTPGQVHSTIRLSVAEDDRAAIKKVASLEAKLRRNREVELQDALTPPNAPQVPAEGLPSESSTSGTGDQPSHDSDVEREEVGTSMEGAPLVYQ